MKMARLMPAAGAAFLLAGCGAVGTGAYSPDRSCVYITGQGEVKSALVLETEENFDKKELEQFLTEAADRFNQKNGGGADGQEGPVALDSCTAEEGRLTAVFDCDSPETLMAFMQSDENEDDSSSFTAMEIRPVSEAGEEGWLSGELYGADGSPVSGLNMTKEQGAVAVRTEGGGVLETEGAILGVSPGAEFLSETAVSIPQGQAAVVIFEGK